MSINHRKNLAQSSHSLQYSSTHFPCHHAPVSSYLRWSRSSRDSVSPALSAILQSVECKHPFTPRFWTSAWTQISSKILSQLTASPWSFPLLSSFLFGFESTILPFHSVFCWIGTADVKVPLVNVHSPLKEPPFLCLRFFYLRRFEPCPSSKFGLFWQGVFLKKFEWEFGQIMKSALPKLPFTFWTLPYRRIHFLGR